MEEADAGQQQRQERLAPARPDAEALAQQTLWNTMAAISLAGAAPGKKG